MTGNSSYVVNGMKERRDKMLCAMLCHVLVSMIPAESQYSLVTYRRESSLDDVKRCSIIILDRVCYLICAEITDIPRLSTAFWIEDRLIEDNAILLYANNLCIDRLKITILIIKLLRHRFSSPTILATGSFHL